VTSTREILSKPAAEITATQRRSFLMGCSQFGDDTIYPPLPGSFEEVIKIDSLLSLQQLSADRYLTDQASESNVRKAARPLLMHIATHAIFYQDMNPHKSPQLGIRVSKARENPLLRAGLLFRDASTHSADPVMVVTDNGLLSAYEASDLDLQGTLIVTLSACETGLGEVVNGEGVYGLSRAFQVAGAERVLMSLWKVDDHATSQLMLLFYKNLFLLKDPDRALVEAQRSLREKYPEPYYWGAFVLLN
jgi:CHAT domain-containing protein